MERGLCGDPHPGLFPFGGLNVRSSAFSFDLYLDGYILFLHHFIVRVAYLKKKIYIYIYLKILRLMACRAIGHDII